MRIDTGADVSCLSLDTLNNIKKEKSGIEILKTKEAIYLAIGKEQFKPCGIVKLLIKFGKREVKQNFFVFNELQHEAILGLDWLWDNNIDLILTDNKMIYTKNQKEYELKFINQSKDSHINHKIVQLESFYPFYNSNLESIYEKTGKVNKVEIKSNNESNSKENLNKVLHEILDENHICVNTIATYRSLDLKEPESQSSLIHPTPTTTHPTFEGSLEKVLAAPNNLTETQFGKLKEFLIKYKDSFSEKQGVSKSTTHRIKTGTAPPIQKKPYVTTPKKRQIITEHIESMLAEGVISHSVSAWSSPIVLIGKPDGSMRFCVDYRALNAITESDQYPMPSIEYIIGQLNGAKYLSSVDLCSGYWNIPVDPQDREKTAFTCHKGLYEFNVMPFGLKTAPSTFNRMMAIVLKSVIGKKAFAYLDDVVIYSKTFEQHLLDLAEIFQLLKKEGLVIKIKKCQFCTNQFKFLGKVIKNGTVEVDPAKVEAIQQLVPPKNGKGVQRLLGMTGWLRNHIRDYAKISRPLVDLTKKGYKFKWDDQCQIAFQKLKDSLMSPGTGLLLPNFDKTFTVETDASAEALGAVLTQVDEEGFPRVIEYASRLLHPAETRYTVTEKECLAIVWAVKKFRGYLSDSKFVVKTDHNALKWLLHTKDLSGRLTRWALRLQEFCYEVIYTKGKNNLLPDALSRSSCLKELDSTEEDLDRMTHPIGISTVSMEINFSFLEKLQTLKAEQRKEPWINNIIKQLESKDGKPSLKNYTIENNILCYVKIDKQNKNRDQITKQLYPRPIIPRTLVHLVLEEFHDNPVAGHSGIEKTKEKIVSRMFWPKMTQDIKEYVKSCKLCQLAKYPNKVMRAPMTPTQVSRPMELVAIDLMGPYPRSKRQNKFLLVFTDYYSRWVEIFPLKNSNIKTIVKHLVDMFCRYGPPERILSDNGPQFISRIYKMLCKVWGIRKSNTTKYHPQTNMTERQNQNIKRLIRTFIDYDQTDWDRQIPQFAYALRTTTNMTTGFSPAKLFLQRELRMPWDNVVMPGLEGKKDSVSTKEQVKKAEEELKWLKEIVEEHVKKQQQKQKAEYDKKSVVRTFKVGDKVKVKNHTLSDAAKNFSSKLAKPWMGPLLIKRKINEVAYEIQDKDGKTYGNYNIIDIEHFTERENEPESTKVTIDTDPLQREHTHRYPTRSKK